jgi:hypothetical protein
MDYKELDAHRKKILLGLVDFYYERGYTSSPYMDSETGGIYENKLADILDYSVTQDNQAPPEFIAAAGILEEQGYVRRLRRNPDVAIMGIWPTYKGLEEEKYLRSKWYKKVLYKIQASRVAAASSGITVILRLFGIGK